MLVKLARRAAQDGDGPNTGHIGFPGRPTRQQPGPLREPSKPGYLAARGSGKRIRLSRLDESQVNSGLVGVGQVLAIGGDRSGRQWCFRGVRGELKLFQFTLRLLTAPEVPADRNQQQNSYHCPGKDQYLL